MPTPAMHCDDMNQMVPYHDAGPLSAKLLKNGPFKGVQGLTRTA